MEGKKEALSVANDIAALALINIQDIFRFVLTAKDDEIEERYGSERIAIEVAEKYIEIARNALFLEHYVSGWSMTYSQPIKDSNDRREYTARFYDLTKRQEGEVRSMEQEDER